MLQNLYQKLNQTIPKKHQNVLARTHKKMQILSHRFLGEYMLFLLSLTFLKGVNENWVSWEIVHEGQNFLRNLQGERGEERENAKSVWMMVCFCFNLLNINYYDYIYIYGYGYGYGYIYIYIILLLASEISSISNKILCL